MATSSLEKKALVLGLLMAALAATASCGLTGGPTAMPTVTINNPTKMVVNVQVGDVYVHVTTDVTTIHLDYPEQHIQIQTSEGRVKELLVQDGDVLLLQPNSEDPRNFLVHVLSPEIPVREPKPPIAMTP